MNREDNTDKRNMKEVIKRRNSFIQSAVSSSGFMLKEDRGREREREKKNPPKNPKK